MLNNLMLKIIIEELIRNNLFNKFIAIIFNYSEEEVGKYVIRYKIKNDFIIDIFCNNKVNTFIRYHFINKNNDYYMNEYLSNNIYINDVYIVRCYEESYNSNNKIVLFASLYMVNSIEKVNIILDKLFCKEISQIFKQNL